MVNKLSKIINTKTIAKINVTITPQVHCLFIIMTHLLTILWLPVDISIEKIYDISIFIVLRTLTAFRMLPRTFYDIWENTISRQKASNLLF